MWILACYKNAASNQHREIMEQNQPPNCTVQTCVRKFSIWLFHKLSTKENTLLVSSWNNLRSPANRFEDRVLITWCSTNKARCWISGSSLLTAVRSIGTNSGHSRGQSNLKKGSIFYEIILRGSQSTWKENNIAIAKRSLLFHRIWRVKTTSLKTWCHVMCSTVDGGCTFL